VLEDLGQVLKMNGTKRMYTVAGQEVRSHIKYEISKLNRCGTVVIYHHPEI
jgi:hypothetical protein